MNRSIARRSVAFRVRPTPGANRPWRSKKPWRQSSPNKPSGNSITGASDNQEFVNIFVVNLIQDVEAAPPDLSGSLME